jgi:hypothetical protein
MIAENAIGSSCFSAPRWYQMRRKDTQFAQRIAKNEDGVALSDLLNSFYPSPAFRWNFHSIISTSIFGKSSTTRK